MLSSSAEAASSCGVLSLNGLEKSVTSELKGVLLDLSTNAETSDHSAAYALYRSSPPRSLVEKVAANVRSGSRALAVDVGKEISHKDKLNLLIFT